MSATSTEIDYEQAGELKIGQVGVANLRVRTLDPARLGREMHERVRRAPKLFGRAAVIVDFGGLSQTPDAGTAQALLDALREAGVLPVALAYGTREREQLAEQLGLPLLAKFRAQYESGTAADPAPTRTAPAAARRPAPSAEPTTPASRTRQQPAGAGTSPSSAKPAQPGRMHKAPVRSGQQLYAEQGDLTVLSTVGAGAEVIAEGSIHIYGSLRGRALAGAQGNAEARIFCRQFNAELVAIAGHYKVLEDVPEALRGKPVQVWLEQDQLKIAALE